jgi:hypothetical protein
MGRVSHGIEETRVVFRLPLEAWTALPSINENRRSAIQYLGRRHRLGEWPLDQGVDHGQQPDDCRHDDIEVLA